MSGTSTGGSGNLKSQAKAAGRIGVKSGSQRSKISAGTLKAIGTTRASLNKGALKGARRRG